MDEKSRSIIERGELAKALLENLAVKGTFDSLAAHAHAQIRAAKTPDEAWRAAVFTQVLGVVKDALIVSVKHGADASARFLAEEERIREQAAHEGHVRAEMERARIAREHFDRQTVPINMGDLILKQGATN